MERLFDYSRERLELEEPLVLAGDYNVIPAEADVHNPAALGATTHCSCRRPARSFRALINLGLTDAIRATTDDPGLYTFWDYQAGAWQKNNGIRIDHLLLSPQAADRLVTAGIDKHVRAWEKPSDHVPVWIELEIEPRVSDQCAGGRRYSRRAVDPARSARQRDRALVARSPA